MWLLLGGAEQALLYAPNKMKFQEFAYADTALQLYASSPATAQQSDFFMCASILICTVRL